MNIPQIPIAAQVQRQNKAPLDPTCVHPTRQDAEQYAAAYPTAYAGQTVSFSENGEQKLAVIQSDGTLKEAGCVCVNNKLKFIVDANEVVTVSVYDPEMHKAAIIEYETESLRMGTLRLSQTNLFEINVTGDDDNVVFSHAINGAIEVFNGADKKIEINFKVNYINN